MGFLGNWCDINMSKPEEIWSRKLQHERRHWQMLRVFAGGQPLTARQWSQVKLPCEKVFPIKKHGRVDKEVHTKVFNEDENAFSHKDEPTLMSSPPQSSQEIYHCNPDKV